MIKRSSATAKSNKTNKFIILCAVLVLAIALTCVIVSNRSGASEEISPVSENGEKAVLVDACGVYIDGVYVASVENELTASAAVNSALNKKAEECGTKELLNRFDNEFTYASLKADASTLVSGEELTNLLLSGNVLGADGNPVGVSLVLVSTASETETVTLDYDVKNVYTDALRDGVRSVETEGKNGESVRNYKVTYINGVESEKEVISDNVTLEAVDEIVKIGTHTTGITTLSTGILQSPFDGVCSSPFGPRWGRMHNGIDLVLVGDSCYGKPCYAAADGVVITKEYHNGFGNLVVIEHDGIKTYYAHLSDFSCEVGQVLKAGDEVGKIGASGNVTGPHLHFEVHIVHEDSEEIVDPLLFLSYEHVGW